jgi:ankyrin repeat protein
MISKRVGRSSPGRAGRHATNGKAAAGARGQNVNAENPLWRTPLHEAIKSGNTAVADLLAKQGGQRGVQRSLHAAIVAGEMKSIKKHLVASADINGLKDEQLPLGIALERRYNDLALFLLRKKPDVRKTQFGRNTPLHIAAEKVPMRKCL